jgi:hypothetical protein
MIDLNNTYWEKITGYPTELRVDKRWKLRMEGSERTFGSLRIVSHPDLPPGQLRAFFTYVTDIKEKNDTEIMQTIEDYQMKKEELEVYSVDENIETEREVFVDYKNKLEELFKVVIFD